MNKKATIMMTGLILSSIALSSTQALAQTEYDAVSKQQTTNKVNTAGTVTKEGDVGTVHYQYIEDGNEVTLQLGGGKLPDTISSWPFTNKIKDVKKIVMTGDIIAGKSVKKLFNSANSLEQFEGLEHFDTSQTEDFSGVFSGIGKVEYGSKPVFIDVSKLNTSKATNLYNMFGGSYLTNLDVSNWDTSNVTDMRWVFNRLTLKDEVVNPNNSGQQMDVSKIDLSNWDTSKVTNMQYMFSSTKVTDLNLGGKFTNANVSAENRYYMLNLVSRQTSRLTLGQGVDLKNTDLNIAVGASSDSFTGKYQNLGTGTLGQYPATATGTIYSEDNPKGDKVFDQSTFVKNYNPATDADTYVWQPVPKVAKPITVEYLDENDQKIIADGNVTLGEVGQAYDITTDSELYKTGIAKNGQLYQLDTDKIPDNVKGTFTEAGDTIKLVYKPVSVEIPKLTSININYVDESGKEIASNKAISGKSGQAYDITTNSELYKTSIVKDGQIYQLDITSVPSNVKGNFTENSDTIKLVYKPVSVEMPTLSTVKINYVDEAGKPLAKTQVISGKLGSDYDVTKLESPYYQATLPGYILKEVKNGSGQYKAENDAITLVYKPVSVTIPTVDPKDDGSDVNTNTPRLSTVTINYVDEAGKILAPDQVISGKLGSDYDVTKLEAPYYQATLPGYILKEVKNGSGQYKAENTAITLVYKPVSVTIPTVDPKDDGSTDGGNNSNDGNHNGSDNNSNDNNQNGSNNNNSLNGNESTPNSSVNNKTQENKNGKKAKAAILPQTDERSNILVSLIGLLSLIGLVTFRRKHQ